MKGILLSVFSMVKGKKKGDLYVTIPSSSSSSESFFFQSLLALVERKEKPGRWLACVLMKAIT